MLQTDIAISSKQSCWTNKSFGGVRLRKSAASVVQGPGSYNWSELDTASGLAKTNGKKWSFGVQFGPATPDYIKAKRYTLGGVSSPLPWDPVLLAPELEFIKALGARYDGDPNLGYVVMGSLGTNSGFETFVARDANEVSIIGSAGGAKEWIAGCQQIIAAYAAAFPHTAIVMAAGAPFPNDDTSLKTVVDWAAKSFRNFGVMGCSLKMASRVEYTPNGLVNTYALSHPCGFQFVWNTSDQARVGGTLAEVCDVGIGLLKGRGFIEIYAADGDQPSNADTIARVNGELQ